MTTRTSRRTLLVLLTCSTFTAASSAQAAGCEATCNPNIYVEVGKKVVPSVVNISTVSLAKGSAGRPAPDDLFRRFFEEFFSGRPPGGGGGFEGEGGDEQDAPEGDEGSARPQPRGPRGKPGRGDQRPRSMSLGTGFIIDASGLILTNNHVVAGADEIKIQFTEEDEEKPADGEVVGRDPELDLALIRVKTKRQLVAVQLGDSDALEVGEYVAAVGNPIGHGHTMTHGIISAKGRQAPDFVLARYLQTDTPINPGNSGGPLVNLQGQVVGINNAIDQRGQNIGFAIPINLVKQVLPQLRSKGKVSRGYIGVLVNELTPEIAQNFSLPTGVRGPVVAQVFPKAPADLAGIKPYDLILEFNGKPIRKPEDLITSVTATAVKSTVPVKLWRKGKELTVSLTIAQREPQTSRGQGEPEKRPSTKDREKRPETGMDVGELTPEVRSDLGLDADVRGVVVERVAYGGPADQAGLVRGDVIVEVNQQGVASVDEFYSAVKVKKTYLLRVRRGGGPSGPGYSIVSLNLRS